MTGINWKAYYSKEPQVCDFDPAVNDVEIHRCMAAWTVFPGRKVESILDVGCGNGFFCHWISSKARAQRVVGVDISTMRLDSARKRYPHVEYTEGALPHLPFDDGEFEVVTCIEVLEHVMDLTACFRELARVSSQHVVVTVPIRQKLIETLCPHCLRKFPLDGHLHSFDPSKLVALGKEAGLEPVRTKSYSITVRNLKRMLPWPLGEIAGALANRLKKGPGTFLAGSFRKA